MKLSVSYRETRRSTEGVDEYHGEEHEEGEDEEGDLAPFFQFASEDNGVETALLEACSIVLVVMMMMMFHFYLRMLTTRAAMETRIEVAETKRVVD